MPARSQSRVSRLPTLPDHVWWFVAGTAFGMLLMIALLALVAGGSIYADPCGGAALCL